MSIPIFLEICDFETTTFYRNHNEYLPISALPKRCREPHSKVSCGNIAVFDEIMLRTYAREQQQKNTPEVENYDKDRIRPATP